MNDAFIRGNDSRNIPRMCGDQSGQITEEEYRAGVAGCQSILRSNCKHVCFTGHRNAASTGVSLYPRLIQLITEYIKLGTTDFYTGGAIGFDTLAARAVLYFKEQPAYSHIRLHLVLPCCSEDQTRRWTSTQRAEFQDILSKADDVIYITNGHYYDGCLRDRNKKLIELADACICYCNDMRSGTGQTVRMAQNKGIFIDNLA